MKPIHMAALCAVLMAGGCQHLTTKNLAMTKGRIFCLAPASGLSQILITPEQAQAGNTVCQAVRAAGSTPDNGATE